MYILASSFIVLVDNDWFGRGCTALCSDAGGDPSSPCQEGPHPSSCSLETSSFSSYYYYFYQVFIVVCLIFSSGPDPSFVAASGPWPLAYYLTLGGQPIPQDIWTKNAVPEHKLWTVVSFSIVFYL